MGKDGKADCLEVRAVTSEDTLEAVAFSTFAPDQRSSSDVDISSLVAANLCVASPSGRQALIQRRLIDCTLLQASTDARGSSASTKICNREYVCACAEIWLQRRNLEAHLPGREFSLSIGIFKKILGPSLVLVAHAIP